VPDGRYLGANIFASNRSRVKEFAAPVGGPLSFAASPSKIRLWSGREPIGRPPAR